MQKHSVSFFLDNTRFTVNQQSYPYNFRIVYTKKHTILLMKEGHEDLLFSSFSVLPLAVTYMHHRNCYLHMQLSGLHLSSSIRFFLILQILAAHSL